MPPPALQYDIIYYVKAKTYDIAYDVQTTISYISTYDITCFKDIVCLTYDIVKCDVVGGVPTMLYSDIVSTPPLTS
jgi:hypothetical protein